MKLDNRGFSLVELLVVVGILAILTTMTASAASYLSRGNIKHATKTLYSAITSNRTYSMAKAGEWEFVVTQENGKYVLLSRNYPTTTTTVPDEYAKDVLTERITGITIDGVPLDSIKFAKSTGAVKSINGADVTSGYSEIVINMSGATSKLKLYYLTGKVDQY